MIKEELGLVDHLIYEAYKDKPVCSMRLFKDNIKKNYGTTPSSTLYRQIINYQIKKYGKQLDIDLGREYEKNFNAYSVKKRRNNVILNNERHKTIKKVERLENEKKSR